MCQDKALQALFPTASSLPLSTMPSEAAPTGRDPLVAAASYAAAEMHTKPHGLS